jgi:hypothetical protein
VHEVLSKRFAPFHDYAVRRGWNWIPRAGFLARKILLGRS